MTPVFRHGRLRLYLLRLLDEEPRHGYEVIRLLPTDGDDCQYRIKSSIEAFERVAKESQLDIS